MQNNNNGTNSLKHSLFEYKFLSSLIGTKRVNKENEA